MDELETMFACVAAFHGLLGQAALGGQLLELSGVVAAIVPGLPDLTVANAAVYRDADGLGRALPALGRAYDEAGVARSIVWASPDDATGLGHLREAGYSLYAESPAMTLDLSRLPVEDDPLDDWSDSPAPDEIASVVEGSYGLEDGAVGAALDGWLPGATAYVARVDGRAASCLTIVREGPDAGVFLVGTVPGARGRGLARRLLLRALHEARERGATVSSLQSSRLGYPVYQRLGYVESCRLGMWERGR
jgi:GNAT superfamily N-acetyltransferase